MRNIFSRITFLLIATLALSIFIAGQEPTQFRIGEKITYSVSFDRFNDIAYAELYTISRGALQGKDAVELRWKLRTLDLTSAAFYEIDEERTVFASPVDGLPLLVKHTDHPGAIAQETISGHTKAPTTNFDLVTLIYKIRHTGGNGSVSLEDNDKIFNVTYQSAGVEKLQTGAGDFDVTVVTIQSAYFTQFGITDVKMLLSNDEARLPLGIRFKIGKRSFEAKAATIQKLIAEPEVTPTPTPGAVPTPRTSPTPIPQRTPEPYIANAPLAPELKFQLGESLEYRVTAGGRPVGTVVLRARERKQINDKDSLVLTGTVTNAAPGNPIFALNDTISVDADPLTVAPFQTNSKITGPLTSLNQTAVFDERTGTITFGGVNRVDAPIATHSLLSLVYAMRSFNLKPSKLVVNPVNDTRVAVFWQTQPYIFTLRPGESSTIKLNDNDTPAQLITINTGNQELDQLAIKVWLSTDEQRVPLRFTLGIYQADLVSRTIVLPQ